MINRFIDYTLFRYGSLFRAVDCGEKEIDTLNIARYRYGIMKVIDKYN